MRHLLRHLRRKLAHLGEPLHRHHLVLLAQVVQHHRGPLGVQVSQHQRDGLRVLGVQQLAQLLRVGALQLGQVALRRLLGAAHQHQQVVGALLAKGVDQQAAGVVQASVNHEVLGLQKLPEFLHDLGRDLRRNPAQVGQLLGQPLHVHLRQGAKNLLGQFLAHGDQQDGRLAQPGQVRRLAAPLRPALAFQLGQGPDPFPLPLLRLPRPLAPTRSESSSAAGASSAPARASDGRSPARRSPASGLAPGPARGARAGPFPERPRGPATPRPLACLRP